MAERNDANNALNRWGANPAGTEEIGGKDPQLKCLA